MKNLKYLLLLLVFSSCVKDKQTPICCISLRGGLDVVYLNKQGQNLLDQSTPNYYSVDKMKLYFLEKGKKTLVDNPTSDSPSGITLTKDLPIRVKVLANVGYKDDVVSDNGTMKVGQSTALLQIDENVTDTIKTEWESGDGHLLVMKGWYNSKLVYDVKAGLPSLEKTDGFVLPNELSI
jgi:hypothetical protein